VKMVNWPLAFNGWLSFPLIVPPTVMTIEFRD
jgi:hypothetical protein